MQGYTDVDFEEALADREETRRRLAAGEKLRLVKNGTPFAVLVEPADVDRFHSERETNPASVALPDASARRTSARLELLRRRAETMVRGFSEGPPRSFREVFSEPVPEELEDAANEPESIAYFEGLRRGR